MRSILNSLLDVWQCGKTQHFEFDLLLVSSSTNFALCRYEKCKTYCGLFGVSLFDLILMSTDGPNNSIPQSFRTALNLCATYAPNTQEAESGLQDLCNRTGI